MEPCEDANAHIRTNGEQKADAPSDDSSDAARECNLPRSSANSALFGETKQAWTPADAEKERKQEQHRQNKAQSGEAHFDARVFSCPTNEDAMRAVLWRHKKDCYRNAIANIASAHFSSKQLHGKSTQERLKMLALKGVDPVRDYPAANVYGVFIKREQFPLAALDRKTGKMIETQRTRPRQGSFAWGGSHDEKTAFVFDKYWK